jgi:hypothetical protein
LTKAASIREQRQRAGGDPAHDLGDHEARGQHERPEHPALVVGRGVCPVRVAMSVAGAVVVGLRVHRPSVVIATVQIRAS